MSTLLVLLFILLFIVLPFVVSLAFAYVMDVRVNTLAAFALLVMWTTYLYGWMGNPQIFIITIISFLLHMTQVKVKTEFVPKYEKLL